MNVGPDARERHGPTTTRLGADPDSIAIIAGSTGEQVTYGELDERSRRLARLFHDRGLRRGDHIAVLMDNNLRYHETCWAAQRSGLYYTPVNWHLTAEEAAYIVEDCGARGLVASSSVGHVAAAVSEAVPQLDVRLAVGRDLPGFDPYDTVVAETPAEPAEPETEGMAMFYSSGTTGRPKGIARALTGAPFGRGIAFDALLTHGYGFTADVVYLSPAPLYHAAPLGWSMSAQRLGATIVVMDRFDPIETLKLVERHRVTHTQMVPTMFIRLLKLPDDERLRHDLDSLGFVVHAAAPCPVEVKEQMLDWWGPIIHEYYAGSEGNGFCAIGPDEWLAHKGSVGRPLLGTVHIVGPDGDELPAGEVGTVYFESDVKFEYHNDPAKTAEAFDRHGWSTLGDLGHVDDEGYLYLSDRRSHLIISGGVNIYPQEVEDALVLHPAVADVAVIGVPDAEMGEQVKAVVQLADPNAAGPALEEELIGYCRQHLAHFKCPRSVDFDPELPRLPTGKLAKRLLIDRYRG